jgi:hypothetical protein
MLAHEGKLADLVQEHLAQPKKQGAAAKGRKEVYTFPSVAFCNLNNICFCSNVKKSPASQTSTSPGTGKQRGRKKKKK